MKPLDLIWVDTDKSVNPTRKKIRSRLCGRKYKTKKQGKIQRSLYQLLNCSLQCDLLKREGAYLNHDVGEFVEKRETLKLRHHDISRAHFKGKAQRLIYIEYPQRIVRNMAKTKVAG